MKTAIVTGSAKGLGRAIALMLAREGYAVVMNYNRSPKEAARTLSELRKINASCIAVRGDLTKEKNVSRLIAAAEKKFRRIDVLVNNVGDFLYRPLLKTTPEEIGAVFRNNVITAFMCSKKAVEVMRKRKHGRLINIGSTGCDELLAPEMATPYYMAKTSLLLMTKSLARALPPGITVNMVCPGVLKTSVVKKKGIRLTTFDEVTVAIKKLIRGRMSGKVVTIAKWKPDG